MNGYQHFLTQIKRIPKKIMGYKAYILPIVLFVVFIASFGFYTLVGQIIQNSKLISVPVSVNGQTEYPILTNKNITSISAEAAIVMDNSSKVIIYAKNPGLRFSPASTTKLMTALTALSYFKPTDVLTIKSDGIVPIIIGFVPGQKVTFLNLLKGMLIPSGNDAAIAISQNYPGGENAFIAKMNQNAKKFRLYNTHFGDPVGLTDDQTYTTVVDLARLASMAIANPIIAQIVNTSYTTIQTVDGRNVYPLKTTNDLLGQYGINGIKTGTTEEAWEVFVSSLVRNNHTFIIIVMRSNDRFADTKALINSVVDNVTYQPVHL